MISITDEMVEAAAIAIRTQAAARSRRARDWCELPDRLRDEYRAEARSALVAALAEHQPIAEPLVL